MTQDTLNRRRFLLMTTTTVASILVGCQDKQTILRAQSESLDASAMMPSSGGPRCDTTSKDITGPYWRPGIPVRQNFDLYGHEGARRKMPAGVQRRDRDVARPAHAHPGKRADSTRLGGLRHDGSGVSVLWPICDRRPGSLANHYQKAGVVPQRSDLQTQSYPCSDLREWPRKTHHSTLLRR